MKNTPGKRPKGRSKSSTTTSRNISMLCCGRRKEDCKCFASGQGQELVNSFRLRVFNTIPPKVKKSRIQQWQDTHDMPEFKKQVPWQKGMKYWYLFAMAFMWRHFNNEHFWAALIAMKAFKTNCRPNWDKVRKVLCRFKDSHESWFGGLFYSGNVLSKYRFSPDSDWIDCDDSDMSPIDRQMQTMKIVWHTAQGMQKDFVTLQTKPTREAWHRCTEGFLLELKSRTSGTFNHYTLKCMCDAVLLVQPQLEKTIGWWPMLCPAYKDMLPKLYPKTQKTQSALFIVACHYHQQMKSFFPKFYLRDSLAQLCWIERKVS